MKYRLALFAIMLMGGILASVGITHQESLPEGASFVSISLSVMSNNFDLTFFKHPSLYFNVVAIAYWIYYGFLHFTGQIKDFTDFIVLFYTAPGMFVVIARVVSLLAFGGLIAAVVQVGRKLWTPRTGLIAGFITASSPALLALVQIVVVDMLALCLTFVLFLQMINVYRDGGWKSYLAGGAILGLAMSANYPVGLGVLFFVWTGIAHVRSGRPAVGIAGRLGLAGVASVLFFCVTSPYIVIQFDDFVKDFIFQSDSMWAASEARDLRQLDIFYYMKYVFAEGGPLLIPAIAGVLWRVLKGSSEERMGLLFVFVHVLFFLSISTWESRWMAPVIPFMGLFSAVVIDSIITKFSSAGGVNAPQWKVVVFFVLCLVIAVTRHIMPERAVNNRNRPVVDASDWLLNSIESGDVIMYERHSILINHPEFFKLNLRKHTHRPRDRFFIASQKAFDRIMLSEKFNTDFRLQPFFTTNTAGDQTYYDPGIAKALNAKWIVINTELYSLHMMMYKLKPEEYRRSKDFYEWLKRNYEIAAKFGYGPQDKDIEILIYKRSKPFSDSERYRDLLDEKGKPLVPDSEF